MIAAKAQYLLISFHNLVDLDSIHELQREETRFDIK